MQNATALCGVVMFNAEQARHLARLLKVKQPTQLERVDIESLVYKLGAYGEALQAIANDRRLENGQ